MTTIPTAGEPLQIPAMPDPDSLSVRILAHRAELLQTVTPGIIHHLANAGQGLAGGESSRDALDQVALRLEKARRVIATMVSGPGVEDAPETGAPSATVDEVLAEIEVWQRCQIMLPRVRVVFEPHAPLPRARIRPDHLRDALAAIVTNAKEAMVASPAGEIRISAEASAEWLSITVVDDGPGIDLSTLARLFKPYNSTRSPGSHLGLGLSVAHEILARAGGDLSIAASKEAPHTRVSMRLPVIPADPGLAGDRPGSTARQGGGPVDPPRAGHSGGPAGLRIAA